MFKCEITGKNSKPGEKPVKIVTKTRKKEYFNEENIKISEGWEILEEKSVLPDVAKNLTNK